MKQLRRASIIGTGMNLPDQVLSNDDLVKIVDTSDEWITTRTGIKNRHKIEDDKSLMDLTIPAAKQAIKNAGLTPEDIDLIVFATFTPDFQFPSSACILQNELGCTKAAAFDLEAACTGFVYASSVATQFIVTGTYDHVLVVGGDVATRVLDFEDRNTCVLFGDGVGAAVFGPAKNDEGAIDCLLGAIGSGAEYISIKCGGSRYRPTHEGLDKREQFVSINGKEVFKFSTKIVGDIIEEVLTRNNLTLDDVKLIVPHQANIRIIESAAKRFNCPIEKFFVNIHKYGNTVAASIPIALHEALLEGRIKEGDLILIIGFGGGLTYGVMPIRWGSYTSPE